MVDKATAELEKSKAVDPDADRVPEPADDAREERNDDVATDPPEPPEKEAKARPELVQDDARTRAAQRYRELRDAQKKKDKEEDAEAGDGKGSDDDVEKADDDAAEEAAAEADAAAEEDAQEGADKAPDLPKKVTLLVDGKPTEVTLEEAINLAQIAKASDNRLEESKRLVREGREFLNEAKTIRDRAASNQPDREDASSKPDQSQASDKSEHPPAKRDPAKLKQIAERIQVGDTDEAAEALSELIDQAVESRTGKDVLDPTEVDKRVDQRLIRKRADQEFASALERFGERYGDIATDPDLKEAGGRRDRSRRAVRPPPAGARPRACPRPRHRRRPPRRAPGRRGPPRSPSPRARARAPRHPR